MEAKYVFIAHIRITYAIVIIFLCCFNLKHKVNFGFQTDPAFKWTGLPVAEETSPITSSVHLSLRNFFFLTSQFIPWHISQNLIRCILHTHKVWSFGYIWPHLNISCMHNINLKNFLTQTHSLMQRVNNTYPSIFSPTQTKQNLWSYKCYMLKTKPEATLIYTTVYKYLLIY